MSQWKDAIRLTVAVALLLRGMAMAAGPAPITVAADTVARILAGDDQWDPSIPMN